MSLATLLFIIGAILAGICFFVPEVLRLRLIAGAIFFVAAGLAVGGINLG